MALVDPKDYQPKNTPVTQSDFLEAFKALLTEIRGSDDTAAKERLLIESQRLLIEQDRIKRDMPENKQSPGISVYSYPEGDHIHPKPPLKCKMFWVGYELTTETLTPLEVELLNRLEAGEYRVTKTDGSDIPFNVQATKNQSTNALEKLVIWFPCKGDQKHNHHSMTAYLQQALGDRIPSLSELQAELDKLRAELALSQVGVSGRV